MTDLSKKTLSKTPFFSRLIRSHRRRKIRNHESTLIYIHIGKCGGVSLWRAINNSPVVKKNFNQVEKFHVSKAPALSRTRYLIVIRNPIERAISAFNWRHKLVVDDAVQKDRFVGEYEILSKYGTLNSLAENLYREDVLDQEVANEFRSIHHLKQNIAYYLSELLREVRKEQISWVLATETLDRDIERLLEVTNVPRTHEHSSSLPKEKKDLSDIGHKNLKRFLSDDYDCITKLLELNHSTTASRKDLLS